MHVEVLNLERDYYHFFSFFRYLATGDCFKTRVGHTTVANAVKEPCVVLWEVLQPRVLPVDRHCAFFFYIWIFKKLVIKYNVFEVIR